MKNIKELINTIENEINQILDNDTNIVNDFKNEHYRQGLKKIQNYLLKQIPLLKIEEQIALNYELLGELIVRLEDMYDYHIYLREDHNDSELLPMKKLFKNKNFLDNFIALNNPSDFINNIKGTKLSFMPDAYNVIRDKNDTFELFVHTTSKLDTEEGQDKQIFNLPEGNIKNIYIIDALIKQGHRGVLLKEKKHEYINLLPFLSLISKICFGSSKISANENLVYFMKTGLIVLGDNGWSNYNKKLITIFSKNYIGLEEWFFSESYNKNQNNLVTKDCIMFLVEIVDNILKIIDLRQIDNFLQENEKLLLSQLYNLIKAVFYFADLNSIELSNIKNMAYFCEEMERFNRDYGGLRIKNDIEFTNYKQIDFNIFKTPHIYNEDKFSRDLQNIILIGSIKVINNFDKIDLSPKMFILELCNILNFSKQANLFRQKQIKYLEIQKEFNSLINFKENPQLSIESVMEFYLTLFLYKDFPSQVEKFLYKNNLNEVETEKAIIFLFLSFFSIKNKETIILEFQQTLTTSLAKVPRKTMEAIEAPGNKWIIYLLCELFFPNNLNWSESKTLSLKKLIYKYSYNLHITNNSYDYISNAFQASNTLKNVDNPDKEKHILYIEDDKLYFKYIVDIYKSYKFIPENFVEFLMITFGAFMTIKFYEYLKNNKELKVVQSAILWKTANRNLTYTDNVAEYMIEKDSI